jgi:predicted ATPase
MIRLIEALNYRCLRYVRQPLGDFHVLVGPNASGKTTFLDVVAFLGDLLNMGVEDAIRSRTPDFRDLLFAHQGNRIELAVEMEIPPEKREQLPKGQGLTTVRYEVALGWVEAESEVHILDEKVVLLKPTGQASARRESFPHPSSPPASIMTSRIGRGKRCASLRFGNTGVRYLAEPQDRGSRRRMLSIRLSPKRSSLANLPEDETIFPVSSWLRTILCEGVQRIVLNSMAMRQSSPPGKGARFRPDGSNLPWVVHALQYEHVALYRKWLRHVQTALPDLARVRSVETPDTRHRHLRLVYRDGLVVPSWLASDGTLRLLALTIPAYLPDFTGVCLIEEPENGIHPLAMETVFNSLRSVYSGQVLLATHSPAIVGQTRTRDILCFRKDATGATDIVAGDEHPRLKAWQGSLRMDDLYASGVLG